MPSDQVTAAPGAKHQNPDTSFDLTIYGDLFAGRSEMRLKASECLQIARECLDHLSRERVSERFGTDAAAGLELLGMVAVLARLAHLQEAESPLERSAAMAALTMLLPHLIMILGSRSIDARLVAGEALGTIGPTAHPAIQPLIWALQDDNLAIRRVAVEALTAIGRKAVQPLLNAMTNRDAMTVGDNDYFGGIRATDAIMVFTAVGPESAVELAEALDRLIRDLQGAVPDVHAQETITAILGALEAFGPAAAPSIPALIRLLREESQLNGHAIRVLLRIGTPAIAVLAEVARNPAAYLDVHTRWFAVVALHRFGPRAREAVPALAEGAGTLPFVKLLTRPCGTSLPKMPRRWSLQTSLN